MADNPITETPISVPTKKSSFKRNLRLSLLVSILAVTLTFLVQNWATVDVRFLVFTVSAPLGAMILLIFVLGFFAGFLSSQTRRLFHKR